jgi:hypothetical protein
LSFALLFLGCSAFDRVSDQVEGHIESGNYQLAIEVLEPLAKKPSDDQLIYLLDLGVVYQMAGNYKKSIEVFLEAEKIADIKDYTSLTRAAGSVILNEGLLPYKGEDFEKVLINIYLSINFIMLGEFESARVEARKINEKLQLFQSEAKRPYSQIAFARLLAAILWERERNYDSAYIDTKLAYQLDPNLPGIREDLLRLSRKSQREQEHKKWKAEFSNITDDRDCKKDGEIIIIHQFGRGPQKRPNPDFVRLPRLYPRSSRGTALNVTLAEKSKPENRIGLKTELAFDLERVAMETMNGHYAGLIAKRIGGLFVKEAITNEIAREDQGLALAAWIGMHVVDRADLRQWTNLPKGFGLARACLKPGEYTVSAEIQDNYGLPINEAIRVPPEIVVGSRSAVFLHDRSRF